MKVGPPYPGPQDMARLDVRLGDRHFIIRGPFKEADNLWTLNEPSLPPRGHTPKPGDNPEWLHELGRYHSPQRAIGAAFRALKLRLAAPKRKRRGLGLVQ